jgi:GR25 family glycosyltransferase involved in LPS biosynthesis
MEPIYKILDKIYCINLISRPDRYDQMKKFEAEENINIKFYRPEKNVISGRIGCFTSHINCVKNAYLMKYSLVMIFEDDVTKTNFYKNIDYEQIKKFMQTNETWEILKFSSTTNPLQMILPNDLPNIYNGPTLLGTSYILNRKGIEKIMNTYSKYINTEHLDWYYSKIFPKTTYNIIPIPFDQRWDMGSDNSWKEFTFNEKNQEYARNILDYKILYYASLIKYYNLYLRILIGMLLVIYIVKINKQSNH